jgi:NADPH:quinone reductase-like Zn-dependent oxidoreductase
VHWESDVIEGRFIGAAAVARLHADATFLADLEAAKTELAAVRAHGLEMAKREGAHQVFDHRKAGYQEEILQATGNRGVDIILEMLANVNLFYDTKLLANNGCVIVIIP